MIIKARKIPDFQWFDVVEEIDADTGVIHRRKIKHTRDLSAYARRAAHWEDDEACAKASEVARIRHLWCGISATAVERLEPRLRRYFRKESRQQGERIALHAGLVGKNRSRACSNMTLGRRNRQKEKTREWASRTTITMPYGEAVGMDNLIENARRKRIAMNYVKLKGLEKYARQRGLVPCFITLTAPPHFHPNPAIGSSSWDGSLPDETTKWLMTAWARLRARLSKLDITMSGARVTECHDDACPHGHILSFVPNEQRADIEFEIRKEWKTTAAAEIRWLDDCDSGNAASAASYLMKYVLKSLAQPGATDDRDDAWRATWGIRSIQFFGLPPDELWNALRNTNTETTDPRTALAAQYARNGDYCGFLEQTGGIGIKQKYRPFKAVVSANATEKTTFIFRHNLLVSMVARMRALMETRPPAHDSWTSGFGDTGDQNREKLQLILITQENQPQPQNQHRGASPHPPPLAVGSGGGGKKPPHPFPEV